MRKKSDKHLVEIANLRALVVKLETQIKDLKETESAYRFAKIALGQAFGEYDYGGLNYGGRSDRTERGLTQLVTEAIKMRCTHGGVMFGPGYDVIADVISRHTGIFPPKEPTDKELVSRMEVR